MKKKIIMRGLLGIPLGMALGDVITITSSLIWGQGEPPEGPQAGAVRL